MNISDNSSSKMKKNDFSRFLVAFLYLFLVDEVICGVLGDDEAKLDRSQEISVMHDDGRWQVGSNTRTLQKENELRCICYG